MTIVTINGQRGSGAPEIGMEVARRLQYAYVDRQVLGEAAKRLGTWQRSVVRVHYRPPPYLFQSLLFLAPI